MYRPFSEKEPQIFDAIKFGTVLENVVVDAETRIADYDDDYFNRKYTCSVPNSKYRKYCRPSVAGHPNTIIFLTADAFGVLPPISKLTKEQAMYHFLSGFI